jgi:ELWxxDGT repeat protein
MRFVTPSAVALIASLSAASLHAQAPYLVKDIWPGGASSFPIPVAAGDRVFLTAFRPELGTELWVSAGTDASTTFVDLTPGPDGFRPIPVSSLGSELVFGSNTVGGLWKSDGTPEGTRRISDIDPRSFPSAALPG